MFVEIQSSHAFPSLVIVFVPMLNFPAKFHFLSSALSKWIAEKVDSCKSHEIRHTLFDLRHDALYLAVSSEFSIRQNLGIEKSRNGVPKHPQNR